jgi:prepilin-type N-terminal cleavage/methylation domain-containing protein
MRTHRSAAGGFTLVELLVVIAIIGILIALLLPAVQAVRAAARRTACKNHLRQIGTGALNHLDTHGHYPSSGWGYKWTGDPDMGVGRRQPGGWIYNLLPFIEQNSIHQVGAGLSPQAKKKVLRWQKNAVVSMFICPSRRPAIAYPAVEGSHNADQPETLAKSDYAANGGTVRILGGGPGSLDCLTKYPNCSWDHDANYMREHFDGISSERSEVRLKDVVDGTSRTYFAGEKYLNPNKYFSGDDGADNNSMYQGNDWDVNRWANRDFLPRHDTPGFDTMSSRFGSAHPDIFNMVMCDGSVHSISYEIEGKIHERLGSRRDGLTVTSADLK